MHRNGLGVSTPDTHDGYVQCLDRYAERLTDQLLQVEAGHDANLATQSAGNGAGQLTEVCVVDEVADPLGCG